MPKKSIDEQVAEARRLIARGSHEEMLTVHLVARVLGVSVRTVYEYTRGPNPVLPVHRFGRCRRPRVRIDCEALRRFMHGGRRPEA